MPTEQDLHCSTYDKSRLSKARCPNYAEMDEIRLDRLSHLPSLSTRAAALFNSEVLSDVTFLVESKDNEDPIKFPAHRFILSLASPVFRIMFTTEMAESKFGAGVKVTDIAPSVFEAILRYIYTDNIRLLSVRNALDILYGAQKYMIHHLSMCCLEFIEQCVSAENVVDIYQEVKLYGVEYMGALLLKCLKTIDREAERVLNSAALDHQNLSILEMICSREHLQISSEMLVFSALGRWSRQECERRRIPVTSDNQREVLGNVLYSVQYLAMAFDEFLDGPATCGMLPGEVSRYLLARICGDIRVPPPEFLKGKKSTWKRKYYDTYSAAVSGRARAHLAVAEPPSSLPSPSLQEELSLTVHQDVVLLGFNLHGVRGQISGSYCGGLHLCVSDLYDNIIAEVKWKPLYASLLKEAKIYVEIPSPVLLRANKEYIVTLTLPIYEFLLGKIHNDHKVSNYECRSFHFAVRSLKQATQNEISSVQVVDIPRNNSKSNENTASGVKKSSKRTIFSLISNIKFYF